MKLIIDIPETAYNYFVQGLRYADDVEMAILSIENGIPLSKGQGNLISRQAVIDYIQEFVNHEYATDRDIELVKSICNGIECFGKDEEMTG